MLEAKRPESTHRQKPKWMIGKEATNFKKEFKIKNTDDYRENIDPSELFGKLEFRETKFDELDSNLQWALKMNAKVNWPGKPVSDKDKVRNGLRLFVSGDSSTVYSLIPNNNNGYEWSRITRSADTGYKVHQMNYNATMGDIVREVAHFEIRHAQNPKAYPIHDLKDIEMSAPQSMADISRGTRDEIGGALA